MAIQFSDGALQKNVKIISKRTMSEIAECTLILFKHHSGGYCSIINEIGRENLSEPDEFYIVGVEEGKVYSTDFYTQKDFSEQIFGAFLEEVEDMTPERLNYIIQQL